MAQGRRVEHRAQRAGPESWRHREPQPCGEFVIGCGQGVHCVFILEHGQRVGGRHAKIFIIRNNCSAAPTRAGSSFAQDRRVESNQFDTTYPLRIATAPQAGRMASVATFHL
jgi:hypothetical protein